MLAPTTRTIASQSSSRYTSALYDPLRVDYRFGRFELVRRAARDATKPTASRLAPIGIAQIEIGPLPDAAGVVAGGVPTEVALAVPVAGTAVGVGGSEVTVGVGASAVAVGDGEGASVELAVGVGLGVAVLVAVGVGMRVGVDAGVGAGVGGGRSAARPAAAPASTNSRGAPPMPGAHAAELPQLAPGRSMR